MNYIDLHVGARLRRERIALGRTLCEQAVLIGRDEEILKSFESGLVRVGATDLFECCSSLGLRPSDIFEDLMASFPPDIDGLADRPDA